MTLGKDERPKLPGRSKDLGQLNIGLEGIRLDNCQWKEGVFKVVLAIMNLRNVIEWQYPEILYVGYIYSGRSTATRPFTNL